MSGFETRDTISFGHRLEAEVFSLQPDERRVEAGRVLDAWLPAEQLSRFVGAEVLVSAQHLHGLSREQGRCRQARGLAQHAVAVLEREPKAVRQPIRQDPTPGTSR